MSSIITRLFSIVTFPIAFTKGLGDITLSEDEAKTLNSKWVNYIWHSNFSQSFLAWRRRLLYSGGMLLGISAIISSIRLSNQCNGLFGDGSCSFEAYAPNVNTTESTSKQYTTLGSIGLLSQNVAPFISLSFVLVAAWCWVEYNKSRTFLFFGWLISSFFQVWPHTIPVKYLIEDATPQYSAIVGAAYSVGILPFYLALTNGLAIGSQRVYFFAPSPLTGAMILISALFSIIIPFAALSLLIQLLGNVLLLIGIYSLIAGPVWIVIRSRQFTNMTTFQSTETIQDSQRTIHNASIIRQIGLTLLVIWFFSKIIWANNYLESNEYWTNLDSELNAIADYIMEAIPYDRLLGLIFQFLGSMIFQAVLWTDIVIEIARNDDVKLIKLQSDLSFQ